MHWGNGWDDLERWKMKRNGEIVDNSWTVEGAKGVNKPIRFRWSNPEHAAWINERWRPGGWEIWGQQRGRASESVCPGSHPQQSGSSVSRPHQEDQGKNDFLKIDYLEEKKKRRPRQVGTFNGGCVRCGWREREKGQYSSRRDSSE